MYSQFKFLNLTRKRSILKLCIAEKGHVYIRIQIQILGSVECLELSKIRFPLFQRLKWRDRDSERERERRRARVNLHHFPFDIIFSILF